MMHPKLKALLDLGRVSNLPSVLTNVAAAWFLAGGSRIFALLPVAIGAVLLYLAGTTLNDAVDAKFDREHRRERPIPAGVFSPGTVWLIGLAYLLAGCLVLCLATMAWAGWVFALAAAILVYDLVHKKWKGGVFVMGGCRLLLYLVAATAAVGGVGVPVLVLIWACALFLYIVGLTYVARGESTGGGVTTQAMVFLGAPAIAALILLFSSGGKIVLAICLVAFAGWVGACFWKLKRLDDPGRVGKFVAGLLAGIPLIDALAISVNQPAIAVALILALPVSLALQRIVAAT